jgi:TPR repeat protein
MKTQLLVVLAASPLGGCAVAQPQTAAFGDPVMSFVQRVSLGGRPAAPQAQSAAARGESADAEFRRTYALALAGHRDAMVEVARMYGSGSNGVARDERAMVEWLRQASQMQHAAASYMLYQHYLERGLDRDAVRYEALAVRQGYVLPMRLDPRRG